MTNLGSRVYGIAAIVFGFVGLWWDDFAAVWQPVPDGIPGRRLFAYIAAVAFLAAGVAMQGRRTARVGSIVLMCLYSIFALFWLSRVIAYPHIFGTWSGTAEQLALVMGGLAIYASLDPQKEALAMRLALLSRITFGVCAVAFGIAHFVYPSETAAMVPRWIPPGQRMWAFTTGGAHLLAGLAIVSGVQALLAARLLTAMIIGFGVFVWAPQLFTLPETHMAWAGNAVNLALAGAAWAIADSIADLGDKKPSED